MKKKQLATTTSLCILGLLYALISCNDQADSKYLRWVGDIAYDANIDNPEFKACNGDENILQYFNLSEGPQYLGEKPRFERMFRESYKTAIDSSQTGWIRIRFVVNCEGKSGRYRLLQADKDYKAFEFKDEIVDQLLALTKSIEEWPIQMRREKPIDYYYYLTFKLKDGQIQEILP